MAKPRLVKKNPQLFGEVKSKSSRRTIQKMATRVNPKSKLGIIFEKSHISRTTQNAIIRAIEKANQEPQNEIMKSYTQGLLASLSEVRGTADRAKLDRFMNRTVTLNADEINRLNAVEYLINKKGPPSRALKKAVFDSDRSIRQKVIIAVAKKEGFTKIIKEVFKMFPINSPPTENYFIHNRMSRVLDTSRTTFIGRYRGAPIHLTNKESENILAREGRVPYLGMYKEGKLVINGDEKVLPKEFRNIVLAHEFGEYWGHEFGLATMLYEARRTRMVKRFWVYAKEKQFDFVKELLKLVQDYPKDFGDLKGILI